MDGVNDGTSVLQLHAVANPIPADHAVQFRHAQFAVLLLKRGTANSLILLMRGIEEATSYSAG